MADRAMIRKMRARLLQDVWIRRDGVGGIALFDRNGQVPDLPRHHHFQRVRFGLSAEAGRK